MSYLKKGSSFYLFLDEFGFSMVSIWRIYSQMSLENFFLLIHLQECCVVLELGLGSLALDRRRFSTMFSYILQQHFMEPKFRHSRNVEIFKKYVYIDGVHLNYYTSYSKTVTSRIRWNPCWFFKHVLCHETCSPYNWN